MRIKKYWKVGCYALAYIAELAGLTYFGTKLQDSHENGEISTGKYAIGATALTVGYLATAFPTCIQGSVEAMNAYEDDDE